MDLLEKGDDISNSIENDQTELSGGYNRDELEEESQHEIEKIEKMRLEKQNFLDEIKNENSKIKEDTTDVISYYKILLI